jgi:sn-glycerol 3-phosphate transport system permease protein
LFFFVFMPSAGLIDYHLASWGLAETNWLGDPDIALYAIIGLTVRKNTGCYMLFFLAAVQAIQRNLRG